MNRPAVRQVPEGSGEQGKMEKTGCKIICGAPTTLAVKGLMMVMMICEGGKLAHTHTHTHTHTHSKKKRKKKEERDRDGKSVCRGPFTGECVQLQVCMTYPPNQAFMDFTRSL